MKKASLFTLLTLIVTFALLVLGGCKKEDRISSVSLKDHDPNTAIEMAVGEFDYQAYTVVVSYESGRREEIALTEKMIEQTDLFKMYQVGDHDITLCYKDQRYTFKVSVKRSTFGDLAFPENNVFTYNGKAHTVELDGDLPANAVVTYPGGNRFVNAGTYDVTAIVSCDGYVTKKLSTTVKIERAKYDMSGVKFEGKEVVYDGNVHSVKISGQLPEGVSAPTYTINEKAASSATDVGEYKVIARFANSNPNYEPIPDMEATLKITPAEYTVKGVELVFKNEDGKIIDEANKIYDGKSVTFDLSDYNKISKKVSISFFVYDKDGKVISTSNKNTNMLNVGVYTVKVEFTMADSKNYKPIEPIVCTFAISRADYPALDHILFISGQVQYNGKAHSIAIEGQLPKDVTVSYEYYLDGVLVVDGHGKPVQSVVDAGRYLVKAIFTHNDPNYNEIEELSAKLNVLQAKIEPSFAFPLENTVVYDGKAHSIALEGDIPDYVSVEYQYYLNGQLLLDDHGNAVTAVSEVGEYTVMAVFTVTNANYAPIVNMSGILHILESDGSLS